MKAKLFYVMLPLLLVMAACKNGADSIPELSTMVFNALKAGKQEMLDKCEPSSQEMEKAFEIYLGDTSHSKADRKRDAFDKVASVKLTLNQHFANVIQGAKERNIDWGITEAKDFKYSVMDHKEDYKDASVRIIISTNNVKNVILYKAYLLGSRWTLWMVWNGRSKRHLTIALRDKKIEPSGYTERLLNGGEGD